MTAIQAQMPGVFYCRPSPEADPYVDEGDTVQPGDTIALIEVMKTYNEVTAEQSGTVARFLVADGDEVDIGQNLLELKG